MKIIGHGQQSVYVYYFDQYYQSRTNYYWPCKVGMSKHSVIDRIKNQVKTALPEYPVIGLIIKTDDAYYLEQALHAILRLKHRAINVPGKEWFNTSPEEILTLCQILRVVN